MTLQNGSSLVFMGKAAHPFEKLLADEVAEKVGEADRLTAHRLADDLL